jgi:hypothetical protein
MKRLALFAFAVPWLAACERSPSAPTPQTPLIPPPSFATTILNEKVPVAGMFAVNTCRPEEVVDLLSGFLHYVVTEDIGPTSTDVTIHIDAEGIEGVGQVTGARYSVPINEKDEVTIRDVPPTFREEFDLRYRLIREGSLDNLWFRFTFTFTVPPGTEDVRRFEIECRG